jgi:hypothetical protein
LGRSSVSGVEVPGEKRMEAFETLVAALLERESYWTRMSVKMDLPKEDKRKIGHPSTPRRESDVIAYKAATNELYVVGCKSSTWRN